MDKEQPTTENQPAETPPAAPRSDGTSANSAAIEELKQRPGKAVALIFVQTVFFTIAAIALAAFCLHIGVTGELYCAGAAGLAEVMAGQHLQVSLADSFFASIFSAEPIETLLWSIAAAIAILIPNALLSIVPYILSPKYRQAEKEAGETNSVLVEMPLRWRIPCLLTAAFGEEMLFRWFAFAVIASAAARVSPINEMGDSSVYVSLLIAAVFSSAVFAVVHSQYAHPLQLLNVFVTGVLLCIAFALTGSVIVATLAHFLVNMTLSAAENKFKDSIDAYIAEREGSDGTGAA